MSGSVIPQPALSSSSRCLSLAVYVLVAFFVVFLLPAAQAKASKHGRFESISMGVKAYEAGDLKLAETYFKRQLQGDKHPAAYNNLGLVADQRGDVGQAVIWFRQAVALEPTKRSFVGNLAWALRDLGKYEESYDVWKEYSEKYDKGRDLSILVNMAATLQHLSRWDEAKELLQQVWKRYPLQGSMFSVTSGPYSKTSSCFFLDELVDDKLLLQSAVIEASEHFADSETFPEERDRFHFMPKMYVLPRDEDAVKHALDASRRRRMESDAGSPDDVAKLSEQVLFIKKPRRMADARGVSLVYYEDQLPSPEEAGDWVLQEYIKPKLLRGHKFDFRLYALVTSVTPLVVYLHRTGITRVAPSKYTPDPALYDDRSVHITNTYTQTEYGHTLSPVQQTLDDLEEYRGLNAESLWVEIQDIVARAVVAAAARQKHSTCQEVCYKLYGVDVMIDRQGKPRLLEINKQPDMEYRTPSDRDIKRTVTEDMFRMASGQYDGSYEGTDVESVFRQKLQYELQRSGQFDLIFPNEHSESLSAYLDMYYSTEEGKLQCVGDAMTARRLALEVQGVVDVTEPLAFDLHDEL